MTDTCKISQSAIDLGNDTAKKKYYSTVVNILNEYVGKFSTLDDTRKKIYGMMFEDFTRTGLLTGYDTDALLNNAESWRNILYEEVPGSYMTKKTIVRGQYTSTGFLRAIKTLLKRRAAADKFLRVGKMKFLEMAFADPAQVAFYDRTGYVSKVVNLAKNMPSRIEQLVSDIILPWKNTFEQVSSKVGVSLDMKLIDVQDIGFRPIVHTADLREARVLSHKVIDKVGYFEVLFAGSKVPERITEQEMDMTGDDYNKWLNEQIVAGLSDRIGNDQLRYVVTRSIDSSVINDKELYTQILKLASTNRHKNVISDGKFNYYYVFVKNKFKWNERENTYNYNEKDDFHSGGVSQAFLVGISEVEGGKQKKGSGINLLRNPSAEAFSDFSKVMQNGWYYTETQIPFEMSYVNSYTGRPETYNIKYWKNYEKIDINLNKHILFGQHSIMHLVAAWDAKVRPRVAMEIEVRLYGSKDKSGKVIFEGLETKINRLKNEMVRYYIDTEGINHETALKKVMDLLQLGESHGRFSVDQNGYIHVGNAEFVRVSKHVGYMPHIFLMSVYLNMLDNAYYNINTRYQDAKEKGLPEETTKPLEEILAHLKIIREYSLREESGLNTPADTNLLLLSKSVVFAKHRDIVLDASQRRTDSAVVSDYLRSVVSSLAQNDLIANLFDATVKASKYKIPEALVRHMTNTVKQTLGDPRTEGIKEDFGSYTQMANTLNRVFEKLLGKDKFTKYTPESARRQIMFLRTMLTSMQLGISASLNNATQSINDFVIYGSKTFFRAVRLEKDKRWQEAIAKTGVDNIFTAWEMQAILDEEVKFGDMPFIPGTIIPWVFGNPGKMFATFKMGRDKFIKGLVTDPNQKILFQNLDKFLERLAHNTSQRNKTNIAYLKQLKMGLSKLGGANELENRRAAFYDYWTSDDINLLQARWQLFTGKQSKLLARKMASWKLSYLPDIFSKGEEWLTFPGVEGRMRRISALCAILSGIESGVIPRNYTDTPAEIMETVQAQTLARMSVQMTMFGLTTPHLGRAFDGWTSFLTQWKHYPLKQTRFDWKVMQSFINSSPTKSIMFDRIGQAIKRRYIKTKNSLNGQVSEKALKEMLKEDPEADQVMRLAATRLFASTILSVVGMTPVIGLLPMLMGLVNRASPFNMFGVGRNIESPVIGMSMRLLLWTIASAWGGDDDKWRKKLKRDWLRSLQMLTVPALIGVAANHAKSAAENISKAFGD